MLNDTIVSKFESRKSELDRKKGMKESIINRIQKNTGLIQQTEKYSELLTQANNIFLNIIELKREEIKNKIEYWVTKGLQLIFENNNYVFEFEMGVQRDEMYATPMLWSVYKGQKFKMDLSDSNAGAMLEIISFVLKIICLVFYRPVLSKVIIADEPFKNTSEYYIPKVAEFLKELSLQLDVQIIMNTHQMEFKEVADSVFEISQSQSGESTVKKLVDKQSNL